MTHVNFDARAVPELTRSAGIQLNKRVSLRLRGQTSVACMTPRKPKDLADKMGKSLRARYFEVLKLRELVNQAQSKVGDVANTDDDFRRKPRTLTPNRR
jgi:hypothetical protein